MNMKIIEIEIIKTKSTTVKARADVHFEGFWLKGFKILLAKDTHKEYVTPPSYNTLKGWRPLFRTDTEKDWEIIYKTILDSYNHHLLQESADEIIELES